MLSLKVIKERGPERCYGVVNHASEVYQVMKFLEKEDRENLYVLHLDVKNYIIAKELISLGSLTSSVVHPREVFKGAILNNTASLILVHNHPSGYTTPSEEDIEVTQKLQAAGCLLGIHVLDHVIIAAGHYLSLLQEGILTGDEKPKRNSTKKTTPARTRRKGR